MQGEWPSLNHGMHHSQCILSLSYFTSRYFIIYKCSIKKKKLLFNKIVLTCKNTAILIGNNTQFFVGDGVNTIFNNISVISWRSVLLVEETGVPGETIDLPQVTEKLYHKMLYQVHLDISGVSNLQI